jgi:hypothetical protein
MSHNNNKSMRGLRKITLRLTCMYGHASRCFRYKHLDHRLKCEHECAHQYQIQYYDELARVGSINPHRQTMVDLEYSIRELQDEGHEVVVFLDANQNESR